ncbi:MAG: hypothetical protein ACRDJW_00410 [Thermomicrobiales bacterium]
MEGHRFDRFSKAMARWVSRRRLLGGAIGGAAGLAGSRGAGAGDKPDPAALKEIAVRSADILPRLPTGDQLARQEFDPVRLPLFTERVRDLARVGSGAEWWTREQLDCFLTATELIPLAISAGTDTYLERWATRTLATLAEQGAEANRATAEETSDERPTLCTATCLDVWTSKVSGCGGDAACLVDAFWDFIECFMLFGNEESVCLAGIVPSGCTPQVMCACAGNCH